VTPLASLKALGGRRAFLGHENIEHRVRYPDGGAGHGFKGVEPEVINDAAID
jgi:hypothetical protein